MLIQAFIYFMRNLWKSLVSLDSAGLLTFEKDRRLKVGKSLNFVSIIFSEINDINTLSQKAVSPLFVSLNYSRIVFI